MEVKGEKVPVAVFPAQTSSDEALTCKAEMSVCQAALDSSAVTRAARTLRAAMLSRAVASSALIWVCRLAQVDCRAAMSTEFGRTAAAIARD